MLQAIQEAKPTNITISTGNILNVNKKAGQKPTEELIDCLTAAINDATFNSENGSISRSSDDLQEKITEHERLNIKIGAKIFLNNNSTEFLKEAVSSTLKVLNINCLDNLILAYHPTTQDKLYNDQNINETKSEQKEGVLEWGGNDPNAVKDLKTLWTCLQKYSLDKMICQLGVSDLDVDTLKELYDSSEVQPTITQINLTACCVVPPDLQEFCNQNEVQLLTHSDPEVILTEEAFRGLGFNGYKPSWVVRYQVHVKCRGLLTAKGYIVGAQLREDDLRIDGISKFQKMTVKN